jgi:hypothetical protein
MQTSTLPAFIKQTQMYPYQIAESVESVIDDPNQGVYIRELQGEFLFLDGIVDSASTLEELREAMCDYLATYLVVKAEDDQLEDLPNPYMNTNSDEETTITSGIYGYTTVYVIDEELYKAEPNQFVFDVHDVVLNEKFELLFNSAGVDIDTHTLIVEPDGVEWVDTKQFEYDPNNDFDDETEYDSEDVDRLNHR